MMEKIKKIFWKIWDGFDRLVKSFAPFVNVVVRTLLVTTMFAYVSSLGVEINWFIFAVSLIWVLLPIHYFFRGLIYDLRYKGEQ